MNHSKNIKIFNQQPSFIKTTIISHKNNRICQNNKETEKTQKNINQIFYLPLFC